MVENPAGTLIWQHDRFQQFCNMMAWVPCWQLKSRTSDSFPKLIFGLVTLKWKWPTCPTQVFSQSFWMAPFGSPTPKRTTVMSNSRFIRMLFMGPCNLKKLPKSKTTRTLAEFFGIEVLLIELWIDYGLFGQSISQLYSQNVYLRTI